MAYHDDLKVYWITPPRTASRSCNSFLQYFGFTVTGHELKIPTNKLDYLHICNVRSPYSHLFSIYRCFYYKNDSDKNFEDWVRGYFNNQLKGWNEGIKYHTYLSKPIDILVRFEFLEEDLKKIPFIKENYESVNYIFEEQIRKNNYKNERNENFLNPWYSYYNQNLADFVYENLIEQFELFGYKKNYWKNGTP